MSSVEQLNELYSMGTAAGQGADTCFTGARRISVSISEVPNASGSPRNPKEPLSPGGLSLTDPGARKQAGIFKATGFNRARIPPDCVPNNYTQPQWLSPIFESRSWSPVCANAHPFSV